MAKRKFVDWLRAQPFGKNSYYASICPAIGPVKTELIPGTSIAVVTDEADRDFQKRCRAWNERNAAAVEAMHQRHRERGLKAGKAGGRPIKQGAAA